MARINISEFQFVFGFFHKFMGLNENLGKTFVVPSLLQEGGRGGNADMVGTDLIIEDEYFFQFKVGDRLVQSSSQTGDGRLPGTFLPFFRFNVKNSPSSHQFNALVDLAMTKGTDKVFYIAPLFDYSGGKDDEAAFLDFWRSSNRDAMGKVVWIDFIQWRLYNPLQLETNNRHVICFNHDSVNLGKGYLFSEPKEIKVKQFESVKLMSINEPKTTRETINDLAQVFKGQIREENIDIKIEELLKDNRRQDIEVISIIQEILMFEYDIFWIPAIQKR